MTAQEKIVDGLQLLREPFPASAISKKPKPTKQQTEALRADRSLGIRCKECGQWHHKNVVHLDYVGHAALTDRLLDCDPQWSWDPVATTADGRPLIDENGGMWIRLTVCGVTRLGYGHPDGKKGGDAIKETIGDALRNAAMRFGAALDLWHKGDLHADETAAEEAPPPRQPAPADRAAQDAEKAKRLADDMLNGVAKVGAEKVQAHQNFARDIAWLERASPADHARVMAALAPQNGGQLIDDEIPY